MKEFIKAINRQKAENLQLQKKWKDDPVMIRHLKEKYKELCDEISAKVMYQNLLNDYSGMFSKTESEHEIRILLDLENGTIPIGQMANMPKKTKKP